MIYAPSLCVGKWGEFSNKLDELDESDIIAKKMHHNASFDMEEIDILQGTLQTI